MKKRIDWSVRRGDIMLAGDHVNLNAGTLSPTPRVVFQRAEELRQRQASAPSAFFFDESKPLIAQSRAALAKFIGGAVGDVFLLPNVTNAMNVVAHSLPLGPGDEIVLTDAEYGATRLMWESIAMSRGASIRTITLPIPATNVSEIVRLFKAEISSRTRIVFFSHITSATGLRLPAREIVHATRARNIFVVIDGAHAPGAIDVDVESIGADAYGANAHKWMMGPTGVGFLHASARMKRLLVPRMVGWGEDGFKIASMNKPLPRALHHGTRLQFRLEYLGVADRVPQMVLPEVVDFIDRLGVSNIRTRQAELVDYTIQALAECGLNSASSSDDELSSPMLIFPIKTPRVQETLWKKHRIQCPVTHAAGRSFVRVSCAWWNTKDDIDVLASALKQMRVK